MISDIIACFDKVEGIFFLSQIDESERENDNTSDFPKTILGIVGPKNIEKVFSGSKQKVYEYVYNLNNPILLFDSDNTKQSIMQIQRQRVYMVRDIRRGMGNVLVCGKKLFDLLNEYNQQLESMGLKLFKSDYLDSKKGIMTYLEKQTAPKSTNNRLASQFAAIEHDEIVTLYKSKQSIIEPEKYFCSFILEV